jgi:hypothetical protein
MANSTITTTVTFTGTTTHTVQAAPFLLFGLPPELVLGFTLAIVAVIFLFFRFQVKGVPVMLVWIYKNGSAIMLRAREDLQGIFLDVLKSGKKAEIIKKTGLALPVRYLPNNFKAYIEPPKNRFTETAIIKDLRTAGFKVNVQRTDRKGAVKAYLIEKEASVEKTLAFLDVNLGGMKSAKLYATIEGMGETIDWQPKIETTNNKDDSGNTILLQEMKTAAKGFFALLAEAMQGTMKSLILPLVAGVGLGITIIVLVVTLTGGKL